VQDALGGRPVERGHRGADELLDTFGAIVDRAAEPGDPGLDGRLDRPVAQGAGGAAPRVLLGGRCVSQKSTSGWGSARG